MTPVRWGILSTAKIGVEKVLPAMRRCASVELRGIASRNLAAAQAVATQFGMPRAYGSYEALLADPDIEAVYNPLPNPMHVPLTLAAVQAGKHVLCEKPMAMSAAELDVLRPFANQLHIHEAFMVRHHPQWRQVRELMRDGSIGELRYVQVPFGYFNIEANNIRNRSDQGGGALYDIGCYAIAAGRWFFEAEPERVIAAVDRDPAFGTDRLVSGLLDFGGARQLAFTVATQAARYQRIQLVGTRGRIEIEIPFNPAPGEGCRFHIDDASSLDGRGIHTIVVPACDQYQLQAEAFSQAVRKVKPDASALDDAIKNLRVIEALFASEKSGRFEKP